MALIEGVSTPEYQKVFATNSTGTSIVADIPTTTDPTGGAGFLFFGGNSSGVQAPGLKLIPYAVGSDNGTISMGVFGWSVLKGKALGELDLWVASPLATFTAVTLCNTFPGVASSQIGTTSFFCDAATLAVGNAGVGVEIVAGTGAGPLHVIVSTKGFAWVQVKFAKASETSCNALWTKV